MDHPPPTGVAASVAAIHADLDASQWFSSTTLAAAAQRQLSRLARFHAEHSPHFQQRLRHANLRPSDLDAADGLARLPILRRRDIQSAGDTLFATQVPTDHTPLTQTRTSGSTGEPVVVRRTFINQLFWLGVTLREHCWHLADFTGRFTAIRANIDEPVVQSDWGPPTALLFDTGPAQALPITWDVKRLVEGILEFETTVLLAYPSTLAAICQYCVQHSLVLPRLQIIKTVGETLTPQTRSDVENYFGVSIVDNYSSQELGNIAMQCPHSGLYHTMAETVLVEVLDEAGRPCAPHEVGQIVVTDLQNFATPLIRYAIGDYAQTSTPCPCGRGLPTLQRILGRERNLILMPDGTRHWPRVGFGRFRNIAPITQYQFIQHSRHQIEVRFAVEAPLTAAQEDSLRSSIQSALGHPFELRFNYFNAQLPVASRGKFEEFICRVADGSGDQDVQLFPPP